MDEVICYLNGHPELDHVVLLAGCGFSYGYLKDVLKNTQLQELCIVNVHSENDMEKIEEELHFEQTLPVVSASTQVIFRDYGAFKEDEGIQCLCGYNVPAELLLKAHSWKPQCLLASLQKDYISAFKIWEAYKEHTSYIQLKTHRPYKSDQILEWQKREDNDVEVSVIFPMYNIEKYLDQCIESVTAWKAPYIEFLFVNDGSPDHSRDIVLKWAEKDPRIKLLDKPNGGCASARQYGMEHARGRYIGFIDPDDFIDESMFRKLLKAAMTSSYDISYCGYNEYYENTQKTKRVEDALGWPYCDGTDDAARIRELIYTCRVAIWRCLFRKDMLEKAGIHFYTDLRRFDDLPFKIETFAAAHSVVAVPEHLYYYRLARPGQDVSADDERLYVHFDIFGHLNESIASQCSAELTDCLQISKVQTHLYGLSKIRPEFRDYYLQHTREDLNSTGTYERSYGLIRDRIGQENAERYKEVMEGKCTTFPKRRNLAQ